MAAVWGCIYGSQRKGEKKLSAEGNIRTRAPRAMAVLLLFFGIGFFAVGVIAGTVLIVQGERDAETLVLIAVCFAAFSLLGFFGYAYAKLNYVIKTDEGIEAHRLFRRTKFYRYEEITDFKDTIYQGAYGMLKGYVNGKRIFAIEAVSVGAQAVADRLSEKGVKKRASARWFDKRR